jgi:hypothetical protein
MKPILKLYRGYANEQELLLWDMFSLLLRQPITTF